MSPRVFRFFLPLFLAAYGTTGFLTHSKFGGREIFPLFSWSLYSEAAHVEIQYTARLLELDGRPLTPVADLMAMPAFHKSPDYWRDVGVLNNFGQALDAGDGPRAEDLRILVESNILPGHHSRYEIVRRVYDPLERRASGRFEETRLGVFLKDRTGPGGR